MMKWNEFEEKERWKVTWGVMWRGLMIYLAALFAFLFFVGALSNV